MQEVFEKLIEKLEEQAKLHMDFSKKENISRENRVEQLIQYSCYRNAIEIVKQEAEKYNNKNTNADRIRAMSDEELAMNMMCPNENRLGEIDCDKNDSCNCYECILEWLQSEMEG